MGTLVLRAEVDSLDRPQNVTGRLWSAIQVTTASGLCAVLDIILQSAISRKGFIVQESINYKEFLENRFGRYYQ